MKKRQKFSKLDWFCITALYNFYNYRGQELAEEFETTRQHIFKIIKKTEAKFGKEIFKNKGELK